MAIEKFNGNEIRKIIEVKRWELEKWISEGYLVPSSFENSDCGKRYMWNRNDIYELALFKKLVDFGLNLITAHEFLEAFPNEEIQTLSLAEDNDGSNLIINPNLISKKYQVFMWIDVAKIKNEIDERIKIIFG